MIYLMIDALCQTVDATRTFGWNETMKIALIAKLKLKKGGRKNEALMRRESRGRTGVERQINFPKDFSSI